MGHGGDPGGAVLVRPRMREGDRLRTSHVVEASHYDPLIVQERTHGPEKSPHPGDPHPAGMTGAAGMLATYAAGFLARPESQAGEVIFKLGHAERAILIGLTWA